MTARERANRERRARAERLHVEPREEPWHFIVANASHGSHYPVTVNPTAPASDTCTCIDFQRNGRRLGLCKHTAHVRLVWLETEAGQAYLNAQRADPLTVDRETADDGQARLTLVFQDGATCTCSFEELHCTCGADECGHRGLARARFAARYGLRVVTRNTNITERRTHHMELSKEALETLAQPFDPAVVQWKPQATAKQGTRALAVPYVDPRQYIERLNEAFGPHWSDDYEVLNGGSLVVCRLTVCGVTRTDVGEAETKDDNTATSAVAQAFKRACVKFGLGAYLYQGPKVWVDYDPQRKAFTDAALEQLRRLLETGEAPVSTGTGASAPSAQAPASSDPLADLRRKVLALALTHWGWDAATTQGKVAEKLGKPWDQATAQDLAQVATDMASAGKGAQRPARKKKAA